MSLREPVRHAVHRRALFDERLDFTYPGHNQMTDTRTTDTMIAEGTLTARQYTFAGVGLQHRATTEGGDRR
ncbi:hypothetical protein HSB1_45830 [Halogranum salarium B-1]|uniref:Uncharacterized protein n=1 Tax=Halogranum salarium B-1 TaxID=1210908 RepID=J3ET38_9EURY|nr:hypothetical protein HSB1_45830 [Halogranum salarium B-1]